MVKLKSESYKGIIIEFFKEEDGIRARLPAHGELAGFSQTKKEAFEDAKDSIRFLKKRQETFGNTQTQVEESRY